MNAKIEASGFVKHPRPENETATIRIMEDDESQVDSDSLQPLRSLTAAERLRVAELIDEFEVAREQGRPVSAEELCPNEPKLLAALKSSLNRLEEIDNRLRIMSAGAPPKTIGEFEVLEQIGSGGSGVVFRCQQRDPDRQIAVKVMKPTLNAEEQRRRFRREMQVCSTLNAPGIADVYLTGITDWNGVRCFWIAMKLVDGGTIRRHVRRHDCSRKQILRMFRSICETVQAAHRQGVVHRDLKPSNILVSKNGEPYVVDFGVAAIVSREGAGLTTETVNMIAGTVAWMAPEVMYGTVVMADTRSDIFSLGVILFQLLSGKHPYDAEKLNIAQATLRLKSGPVKRLSSELSDVSPDLDTFLSRLLDRDPNYRYQNLDHVITDIDHLLAGRRIQVSSITLAERVYRWCRDHRLLTAVSAVAVVAVIAGLCNFVWSSIRLQQYATDLEASYSELEAKIKH